MSEWVKQILANPDQYPDDAQLTYNGQPLGTVKDLRNAVLPKADMTAMTEKAARERDVLQRKVQETEQQAVALSQQIQAMQAAKVAATGTKTPLEELETDQYFGPVIKELKAVRSDLAKHQQDFEQAKLIFNAKTHLDAISQVTANDPDFATEEGRLKLLEHMRNNGFQRADKAFRDLTRERDMKAALEKGKAEGIEEGKKLAKVPAMHAGGRRSSPPPKEGAKTVDEAISAALNDQEILDMAAGVSQGEY